MSLEIKEGARVRVTINRAGCHVRDYYGTVKRWTKSGLLSVLGDDGKVKSVSSDNVKVIKQ